MFQDLLSEFVGFCRRNKYFFFHHILIIAVMIYTNTTVSFPNASVHISIKNKVHISVIFHTDDLYIMLVSGILKSPSVSLRKLKILENFPSSENKTINLLLNKRKHSCVFIHHVFHIFSLTPSKSPLSEMLMELSSNTCDALRLKSRSMILVSV